MRARQRPLVAFRSRRSEPDQVEETSPLGERLKSALLKAFEPDPDGPPVVPKDESLMALEADVVADDTVVHWARRGPAGRGHWPGDHQRSHFRMIRLWIGCDLESSMAFCVQ